MCFAVSFEIPILKYMRKTPKILMYSAIVCVIIILLVSISRNFAAHVFLSEYKNNLKKKERNTGRQDWLLRMSLRYSPSNAETYYRLGKLYAYKKPIGKNMEDRMRPYTLSEEYFQEALVRKPADGRNRAVYAWYRGNNGNTREAMEYFDTAIDLGPTDAYLHRIYAMWCVGQVKKEINITNTAQFVEQYQNKQKKDGPLKSYDGRTVNGVTIATLLRKGKLEWDKALSLGTRRDRDVYESLADLDLLIFELDKAIGNYKRAKNTLMMARCYIAKGDYNKAVNILGPIVKAGGTPFWKNLAEVKELLMVVKDYGPGNYQSFYWLGRLHNYIRKTEEAMGYFKTTLHLAPEHIDARLDLAELYNRAGKIDLAINEYETILERTPNHKEATRLLSEAVRLQYKDALQ